MLISCGSSEQDSSTDISENVETNTPEDLVNENFLSVEKWDSLAYEYEGNKSYYIINYAGHEDEESAIAMVDSLKPNFPNAGYLWIPDFASLSGKEMYAVFLDQTTDELEIMDNFNALRKDNKGTYVVRVNQDEERWEAYSPIDIRVDGKKQKMILIYARPEDEEKYAKEGGVDWEWFVADVGSYFGGHHPEILFASVFGSNFLENEIKKIEDQLDLGEDPGFGYVFMDGEKLGWAENDMPKNVISQACDFFGLPEPDSGN